MDALETIRTRRSIRQYTDERVPDDLIRELLEAAMSAPSAGGQQPWHFVVIDDRSLLREVPRVNPYSAMCLQAPLAILVCADPKLETFPGFWIQDCAAAAQNILLAAHARGLGAVWTGIYPMEERVDGFRRLLSLPEEIIPMALIPVGYPAQQLAPIERYREERVHFGSKW